MASKQIAPIDLTPFTSLESSHASRSKVAKELASELEVNGWVTLTGHGISSSRLQQAFEASKAFFDLHYDEKMTAPHPKGIVPHRGYSGTGEEQGAALIGLKDKKSMEEQQVSQSKDLKETFELGSEDNKVQYNIWPSEDIAPGFRGFMTKFFWELNELSLAIVQALALGLDLNVEETQELIRIHAGYENQLRLAHYPAANLELLKESNTSRLAPHSDFTTFTLLFQDQTGGLEFFDRPSNQFISATPKDGVVYLNIGDMGHRYSNGRFTSALHRVVPLSASQNGAVPHRYSIPYFVAPLGDEVVETPSSIVAAGTSTRFEPTTYNKFTKAKWEAIRV